MLEPGDQIDIWVIDKRLGAGGMGSVYRCHNRDAHRILAAIKVLESHVSQHPEARKRFIREAEILFSLEHRNIVKVRNVRVEGATPYIEMEFVRGQSIEDRLGSVGPIPVAECMPLFTQIASALAYLHERGVRHRDIKPANLLLTSTGDIKLVDFGLAMEADTSRLTQGNMSFGTVSYAPPEWVDPERLDPVLWDLYATGVVFWEMLTGQVAFPVSGEGSARQQAFQVVMSKQNHAPLDPGDTYPEALRALIRHLTQGDPHKRLDSAAKLLNQLQAIQGGYAAAGPIDVPTPRRSEPTLIPRLQRDTYELDRDGPDPLATPVAPSARIDEVPIDRAQAPASQLLTADIDDEREARTRGGGGVGIVAAVLVLLLLLGGGTLAAIGGIWWMNQVDPSSREVILTLEGLDAEVPVDVQIDGEVPSRREGRVLWFQGVLPGEREVQWAVGPDCDAQACRVGRCEPQCLSGWRAIEIEKGEGAFTLPFKLAAPAPRPVRLGLGDVPEGLEVLIGVEGAEGEMDGPVWKGSAVAPGKYRTRVVIGDCPVDADPCEDSCPAGCRDAVREIIVPVGDGRHEGRLVVAAPEPKTPDAPPERTPERNPQDLPTRDLPDPIPEAIPDPPPESGPTVRPLVTRAQFSRWLVSHPDWQREPAVAARRADANYLKGWVEGQPPAGTGALPMEHVSPLAARAYCGRRGLAKVTDPPLEWPEPTKDGDLYFELRMSGASVVAYSPNGPTGVKANEAFVGTGFRCAK